ncbi:MAG: hypothetical protein NTV77_03000 [Candidatus Azambacteria bacterium]|nr:hypothetical protein [Candidatus Azambacteria bacterium]
MSTIKNFIKDDHLFVIFLIIITLTLLVRALPENHLDFTSTDTLLSARWWAREGFSRHYFLQLVAGYGKVVRYFDEPELNDHASGSVLGVGQHKLYAAHYPSVAVVPVALLMKLGVEKIFPLRLPSILASIFGLIFLYAFIKKLSDNKYIAFITVAYFGISPIFIKWADSMDYIPIGDFWSFLILLLSLSAFQYLNNNQEPIKKKKAYLYLSVIWASQLFLFLSSYHATFFIFAWLVGLTAFYVYKNRNVKHRILFFLLLALFWASAPIIGFALRMLQSVWYLGWQGAWVDVSSTFFTAGNREGLGFITRLEGMIKPFFSVTGLLNIYTVLAPLGLSKLKNIIVGVRISTLYILPLLAILGAFIILKLKKITNYKIPLPNFIILLAVSPLVETLFLPFTGYRDYVGRLVAPFVGIVIGIFSWMLFLAFKKKSLTTFSKVLSSFFSLIIILFFIIQIVLNNYSYLDMPYAPIPDNDIVFAKAMQNIGNGEKAVFMINTVDTQIPEEELKKRGAQYDPAHYQGNYKIWEYYFDMPLLNFTKTSYLIKDLLFLERRAEFPFTAIITSDDLNLINELYEKLNLKQLSLSPVKNLESKYFFIVEKTQE